MGSQSPKESQLLGLELLSGDNSFINDLNPADEASISGGGPGGRYKKNSSSSSSSRSSSKRWKSSSFLPPQLI